MDGLKVKLQQLLQHLEIVNDDMLSALASKVCPYVYVLLLMCVCVRVRVRVYAVWCDRMPIPHIIIVFTYIPYVLYRRSGNYFMRNLL